MKSTWALCPIPGGVGGGGSVLYELIGGGHTHKQTTGLVTSWNWVGGKAHNQTTHAQDKQCKNSEEFCFLFFR